MSKSVRVCVFWQAFTFHSIIVAYVGTEGLYRLRCQRSFIHVLLTFS